MKEALPVWQLPTVCFNHIILYNPCQAFSQTSCSATFLLKPGKTRYHKAQMATFDEFEQEKKIAELHQKEEEELASMLSKKYGLHYIDLTRVSIDTDALKLIPEKEARSESVAAFDKVGKKISLAARAPNADPARQRVQKLEDRGFKITLFMVSARSLRHAWSRYKDISFAAESKPGIFDISSEAVRKLTREVQNLHAIQKVTQRILAAKQAGQISSVLEIVFVGSLSSDASDVHIEPEEKSVRLRYRLDGILTDILTFKRETYQLLLSRIKLLSGLKLNIKDRAQDGRFSLHIAEKNIEIRTSVLPGAYGESIVMRLLDPSTIALPMETLGIPLKLLAILEKEIKRPNGIILNTGPTGSGKTTTLYAFLRKINNPGIKIVTIEDPIEYHLEGIVQTQTTEKNYTFEKGLRSALRQDPDVIMIGEIRDREVAETAINAALTGHLVFSTLHTNNAAGAFPRLIDLGVNPRIIGSATRVVMAQRLVRVLRDDCRHEVKLQGEQKRTVERVLDSIVDKSLIPKNTDTVWEPAVSPACLIPYKGRVGIFEAILMDKTVENLVERSASERDIAEGVREQGLLTMVQDGILKMLQGVTTLSELARVIDLKNPLLGGKPEIDPAENTLGDGGIKPTNL